MLEFDKIFGDHKPITPRQICLAGGCFWGTQALFDRLQGVLETVVGYANASEAYREGLSYELVCEGQTGALEAVLVTYDSSRITLSDLLHWYLLSIDPYQEDGQGNDIGEQYKAAILFQDDVDKIVIDEVLAEFAEKNGRAAVVEVVRLEDFAPAEDYHQKYLEAHPSGYCHVPLALLDRAAQWEPLSGEVTKHSATEAPFTGRLDAHYERGIYVDIYTGEPLFSSRDKFDAGCGWPAFSRMIKDAQITEHFDGSIPGRDRVEVRSESSDSHLGHVFEDGPAELGGMRYCINSAALAFIPESKMKAFGYEAYLSEL